MLQDTGAPVTLSRQNHLDALRGVAAFIVVIVHFFCVFFPFAVFGAQGDYQQHRGWEGLFYYPPFAFVIAGYSAVCLFFVLSGYVLSYKFIGERGAGPEVIAAIIKRPVRLGGLVLCTVLVGACIWYGKLAPTEALAAITSAKPYLTDNWQGPFSLTFTAKQIGTNLFDIARLYNNPLWTIATELEGSLLVFAFLLAFGTFRYRILVMALLIGYFRNHEYQNFLFGMMAADVMKHCDLSYLKRYRTFVSAMLTLPAIYFFSYPNFTAPQTLAKTWYGALPKFYFLGGSGYCGYPTIGALLIFLLVCMTPVLQKGLSHKLLLYVGKISYAIYAVHFLVLGTFSAWLFPCLLPTFGYTGAFITTFLTSLMVIVPLSHWANAYIDAPVTRLSSWMGKQTVKAIAYAMHIATSQRQQGTLCRITSTAKVENE